MHLFDPQRPDASPGTKALLIDNSAVPHFVVRAQPDGNVNVSIMLRNYDTYGGYSYRQTVMPASDLGLLLLAYVNDPEATLAAHFDWRAESAPKAKAATTAKAMAPTLADDFL
jgi:hypothetical protein